MGLMLDPFCCSKVCVFLLVSEQLAAEGIALPILPGLLEVRTGERLVLSFILRPMLKSKEAFMAVSRWWT